MAMLCQQQILQDGAFQQVLNGLTGRDLTSAELAFASYVVGKDYSSCTVWEVSDYGSFEVWPYFRVICSSVAYGSENMGRGELSCLIALWTISRAPKDSVLILEEPENYVSSRSQGALMDAVAWACATKGVCVVVTTHSPVVLRRLPRANIRLLVGDGSRSRVLQNPWMQDVAAVVGGGVAFKCLLLVEDESGRYFCQALLELMDADLRQQCTFAVMNGDGAIITILNTLPKIDDWIKVVGCFDGDIRGRVDGTRFAWPHVFLPGDVPPEQVLRQSILGEPPERLATELHLEPESVKVALTAVAGIDHHDWLTALVEQLRRSKEEVVRAMVRIWFHQKQANAQAFVDELKACLR